MRIRKNIRKKENDSRWLHYGELVRKMGTLGRHLELTVGLDDTSDVKVEEVSVENGLDDSGDNGNWVEEALGVVSIDPVEDVEESVGSEGEEVVSSDGFSVSGTREHEELWHDGDGFEVDGESPHDLHEHELVVDDESKNHAWNDEELNSESVVVSVVGCLELHPHEVHGSNRSGEEEDLHDGVVEGIETGEKIQVSGEEGDGEEDLGPSGDSFTTARLPYFEKENDDGHGVSHISRDTEQIHCFFCGFK